MAAKTTGAADKAKAKAKTKQAVQNRVVVILEPHEQEKINKWAAARGLSRSSAIRSMVLKGVEQDL